MAPKKKLADGLETSNSAALSDLASAHMRRIADELALTLGMTMDGLERIEAWCAWARAEIEAGGDEAALRKSISHINAFLSRLPTTGTADSWLAVMDQIFKAADAFQGDDDAVAEMLCLRGVRYAELLAPELAHRLRDKSDAVGAAISTYRSGKRAAAATALSNAIGFTDVNNDEWAKLRKWRKRHKARR